MFPGFLYRDVFKKEVLVIHFLTTMKHAFYFVDTVVVEVIVGS